jgi:hypothetical protein
VGVRVRVRVRVLVRVLVTRVYLCVLTRLFVCIVVYSFVGYAAVANYIHAGLGQCDDQCS